MLLAEACANTAASLIVGETYEDAMRVPDLLMELAGRFGHDHVVGHFDALVPKEGMSENGVVEAMRAGIRTRGRMEAGFADRCQKVSNRAPLYVLHRQSKRPSFRANSRRDLSARHCMISGIG